MENCVTNTGQRTFHFSTAKQSFGYPFFAKVLHKFITWSKLIGVLRACLSFGATIDSEL